MALYSQLHSTVYCERYMISVFLENAPLIPFIQDQGGAFSTFSVVRLLIMSFSSFSELFANYINSQFAYVIKRKLHVGLKI